jgi:2-hydroxy-4-carboxymuconate semialdehyde hemiacetal dehydrogenase
LPGAGAFGEKHLDGLKNIDGVTVTSLVGRRLDATQVFADKYGIGHATTELSDTLARDDVDAVILCTPTQIHAEQARSRVVPRCHASICTCRSCC